LKKRLLHRIVHDNVMEQTASLSLSRDRSFPQRASFETVGGIAQSDAQSAQRSDSNLLTLCLSRGVHLTTPLIAYKKIAKSRGKKVTSLCVRARACASQKGDVARGALLRTRERAREKE
jgi:hypothetical protein